MLLTHAIFFVQDNALQHLNTQKCAEVSIDGKNLTMRKCSGVDRQIWLWKRKEPDSSKNN